MKKILVPGGAGYIGSHTVKELIEREIEVVVVDNLETGYRAAVHPKARFYQGDIRDKKFVDSVLDAEKVDAVIHFAANSQVGESMKNPLKYYDNNVGGTRVLLDSMIRHDVKRIVFSSTAATYGEPDSIPIREDNRLSPINAYGETKLAMERMIHWASIAYGVQYVSLRYFNACGADLNGTIGEAHSPETHLIPLVLEVPNGKRKFISVFGNDYNTKDGTCIRDYIHVTDLAEAHILAVEYLKSGGTSDVFNLGNGQGFSVLEVIRTAEEVVGSQIPYHIEARRPGDPAQLVSSNEKARRVLNWNLKYSDMRTIIETAWRWHRAHKNGYAGERNDKSIH